VVAESLTKKRDDTGELTNVVKGYVKKVGASPVAARPAAATTGPGSTPPWKR